MSGTWDGLPEVRSPAGRPLAELLERGPRRQSLPGFDPLYRDIVDYIVRCTHRIWEEKDVGLCRTHYSSDCIVHTLAGPVVGAEAVTHNTIASLAAVNDRRLIPEDVIWNAHGDDAFHTSHRIFSRATHLGPDPLLGPASGRECGVMTIADCVCRENRIVEEWLARDNASAVLLIGRDPWALAGELAETDQAGDTDRHLWRQAWIARTRTSADAEIPDGHPAAIPLRALTLALREDLFGEAAVALSPACEVRWPTGRHGWGRGFWTGCLIQLRALLERPALRLEHAAARPLPGGEIAASLRWALTGRHVGDGIWGPATGRELLIAGMSHYRLRGGHIVEDATVFDELAILRQVRGGLGA